MYKKTVSMLFLLIFFFSAVRASEAPQRLGEPSGSSNIPLAVVCVAGGSLALYGIYKWLYTTSTWTAAGIKNETEGLLRTSPFGKDKQIIWNVQPRITEGLPRNRGMVTIAATFDMTRGNRWFVSNCNVVESDNPQRDLKSPGALEVLWVACGRSQAGMDEAHSGKMFSQNR